MEVTAFTKQNHGKEGYNSDETEWTTLPLERCDLKA